MHQHCTTMTQSSSVQEQALGAPDIDPNDPQGSCPELQEAAATSNQGHTQPPDLPTVLKKLQKWGDYASWGQVVAGSRFIPCKTPLSEEILSHWSLPEAPRHRHTVSALLEAQVQQARHVGMILDLSNHDCLYTDDIPANVHYEHIKLVAKELPPRGFVTEVCNAAEAYWARHPDNYIAIHCAYGFNRTGFVVCCFLVERCGLTVDEALHAFSTARPPGVKHEAFKAELRARYEQPQGQSGAAGAEAGQGSSTHLLGPDQLPESPSAHTARPAAYRRDISNTSLCQSDSQQGYTYSQDQDDDVQDEAAASQDGDGEAGIQGWQAESCDAPPDISPAPAGYEERTQPHHTPDTAFLQHGATPMSENDSLGANDRMIMQGLRAQLAMRQLGALQLKPSQLENLLHAAASPSSPNAGHASLNKRSIGNIAWGADSGVQQDVNDNARVP